MSVLDPTESERRVFADIQDERDRQDKKWGVQNHGHGVWLTILMEEVGEVAAELLACSWAKGEPGRLRAEMIQVAAVVVAWIECLDRNEVAR